MTPSITKGNRIRERKRLERVAQNINGRNKTREIRHMLRRLYYDIHVFRQFLPCPNFRVFFRRFVYSSSIHVMHGCEHQCQNCRVLFRKMSVHANSSVKLPCVLSEDVKANIKSSGRRSRSQGLSQGIAPKGGTIPMP